MKRKGLFIFVNIFLLLLTACNTNTNSAPTGEMILNILEFNDLHGHIEQENGKYGISNAAYLVDQIRKEDNLDNTILIANGDMFQETAISRVSYGEVVVECMNEMQFDMMNLGNHEFDWGLEKVLKYWDGNKENGEANFPLLNANITDKNKNLIEDENILSSTIVEREGIKVGLIGLIGNVYSSITANMTKDYLFDMNIDEIVETEGIKLKNDGADVIIVSIHDGESSGVDQYGVNSSLSLIKYNGEYLIDAVINGHTHTMQYGELERNNGVNMPVIQSAAYYSSSGNLNSFGRIDLKIDLATKSVMDYECSHVNVKDAGSNKNTLVQKIVDKYYDESAAVLEEVYCQNIDGFNKYNVYTQKWINNLMMASTGATASLFNYGGLRSDADAGALGFKEIYNFNPFDNHIILVDISGYDLVEFYNKNNSFYFCNTIDGEIEIDNTYKLAIIDYVYYGSYFKKYTKDDAIDTNIIVRDIIIEELRYYKNTGFDISKQYNQINITNK